MCCVSSVVFLCIRMWLQVDWFPGWWNHRVETSRLQMMKLNHSFLDSTGWRNCTAWVVFRDIFDVSLLFYQRCRRRNFMMLDILLWEHLRSQVSTSIASASHPSLTSLEVLGPRIWWNIENPHEKTARIFGKTTGPDSEPQIWGRHTFGSVRSFHIFPSRILRDIWNGRLGKHLVSNKCLVCWFWKRLLWLGKSFDMLIPLTCRNFLAKNRWTWELFIKSGKFKVTLMLLRTRQGVWWMCLPNEAWVGANFYCFFFWHFMQLSILYLSISFILISYM